MNLSLALVVGVAVVLPGLTALVLWNLRAGRSPGRRPELALTSTSALFILLGVSLALHAVGLTVTSLIWSAASDLGEHLPPRLTFPIWPEPYDVALSALAHPSTALSITGLAEMLGVITTESLLAAVLTLSSGLEVALDGVDVGGQGWTYGSVVRPVQHGYTPFAYVLTNPPQGDVGLAYQGVIADIRQGPDGQVTSIALAEPEAFTYAIQSPDATDPERDPLLNGRRRSLDGVIIIDGPAIRNILIRSIPTSFVDAVASAGEHVA